MKPPEEAPGERARAARAPSVESLRERSEPQQPSGDSLREQLKALPTDERAFPDPVMSPARSTPTRHAASGVTPASGLEPAPRFDDDRPLLVDDDFVLSEADPATEEQLAAARAERRRRRELRRAAVRRRKRRRALGIVVLVVLALVLGAVAWVRWTTGGLDRIPGALNSGTDTPGTTILYVASDPSAHDEVSSNVRWKRDLGHSDLVMLVHLPEAGGSMYGVSLPGRMLVELPDGSQGRVGSTMSAGGQAAYLDTVERATGVHVDHLAVMDLGGLQEIIDKLGGISARITNEGCGEVPGEQTLDGLGSLEIIRYRSCLPKGDLDRVARQQAVLKAVLAALVDGGALPNPFTLNSVARSTFSHLAVDEDWSLWQMAGTAWSQRRITPRTTTFLTAPTRRDERGRLHLDEARAAELFASLRADRLEEYVALNRQLVAK